MALDQDRRIAEKPSPASLSAPREPSETSRSPLPTIALPKGGGAIRGIGEKFAANPVTGTGSMTVPIATSPGRSGFGPQFSLSYDSGAGNGPFGFGWSLALPSLTRKTDKGLPQYMDEEESDIFILSGAEDLVALLVEHNGQWVRDVLPPRTVYGQRYSIHRYRPRVEGLFARIERWVNLSNPQDTFWRSISKDNITTWYGKTAESRIADPADPTRVFTWLICESYDDKGNVIVYRYKPENSDGVDLSQIHERNRSDPIRSANRYLKHVFYANRTPYFPNLTAKAPVPLPTDWCFELVFDYGEHDEHAPVPQETGKPWDCRTDPFSTYRATFEVRTYRLCRRALMFHHFANEPGVGLNCLVRSTNFTHSQPAQPPADSTKPSYSFLLSVTQSGYRRNPDGSYLSKALPPLEFAYSEAVIDEIVKDIDPESLENLPIGLDGASYQWMDLDGEGLSGILTEQADGWYYKRNLSENTVVHFGPLERVASKPAVGLAGGGQFLDLAGDGQVDLVQMEGPVRGFYERTAHASWTPFQPFASWPDLYTRDPDLRFVDLTGDGHADILITEGEQFCWYPSLAEEGFGPAVRVRLPSDEERGPRLVFADGTQSIYLADVSGDGLSDLVRIRNGEVCYWPNLGYGRFGARVTMDHAPWFDSPDQFDQRRIRLADTDGSGTTDILYLRRDGVQLYFNQSGNRWSEAVALPQFPPSDTLSSVQVLDLLGNGTACLVWSSPLPGAVRRPMRYLALMEEKPHLLVGVKNNLGAETMVHYAPSTKFYLDDKRKGKPWVTRLPFPVHVVERVETDDRISRNHFVTCYTYHHGYFDGVEREFRGFGMVEQRDTEEFETFAAGSTPPETSNLDAASHVPPVLTKTWFHTGVYAGRDHVSDFFAGLLDADDTGEYYREPGLTNEEARQLLLEDTVLPGGLTVEEEREACRALKGSMLRQEIYAHDGTDKAEHPYTVTEQNFTIERLQPKGDNRYAVFFTHAREAISSHYERHPADPRVSHTLTLEVDPYGNVLKSLAVGYGRRPGKSELQGKDKEKQEQVLITYTENDVTRAIDAPVNDANYDPDNYRTPLPAETRSYEITGLEPAAGVARFSFDDFAQNDFQLLLALPEIQYEEPTDSNKKQKRLIEQVRTLYRADKLTALLPLGQLEPLALAGESYKLAFPPGLAKQIFVESGKLSQVDLDSVLADEGKYVHSEGDNNWWIPSGRVFYSPTANDLPAPELAFASAHFFLPHRHRDPFHTNAVSTESFVTYDGHDLLMVETRDPLGNVVTVKTQDDDGNIAIRNDYRVLQPYWVTDPNRNRTQVEFDALGMVVATAVMGKPGEDKGDLLEEFDADPPLADRQAFIADPQTQAASLLGKATTRIVYDLDRYQRANQPPFAARLARETHFHDSGGRQTKIQISFSYSDGFGREIQKKTQAEAGDAPQRQVQVPLPSGDVSPGDLARDAQGKLVQTNTERRWVGTGRTVYNNKGKPVRQYEPFFSATHLYELEREMTDTGVSPVLYYDPVERVVATLHPNHTWEKLVFDPWQQATFDVNDTTTLTPSADDDVKGFFLNPDGTPRIPSSEYLPTWYGLRTDPLQAAEFAAQYPDAADRSNETTAAAKAAAHANTPTVIHFDTLGRPFLTIAHNKVVCPDHDLDGTNDEFYTRVELDIEGNQRAVRDAVVQDGDALGRIVMRYDYDMLGNRIHQASMEAGERWMLNDVVGKPLCAWDSRGHTFRTEYDPLRRPLRINVTGADSANSNQELLTERMVYGEQHPEAELHSLRGQLYLHLDQAGVVLNEYYDFKGNLQQTSRRLTNGTQYKQAVDWRGIDTNHAALPPDATTPLDLGALEAAFASRLEAEAYTSLTTYDALNRPVALTTPHTPSMKANVIRPGYNEANLLERVEANLQGTSDANGQPIWTSFITNIDYNPKGQRTLIDYGNGAKTTYEYDPLTFRLVRLLTRRDAVAVIFPDDCPQSPPAGWPGCQVQNLHYTYDPVGNITHIRDDAQQTIYFRNKRVEPSADYTYDAVYRLIEATGREHLGQNGRGKPLPPSAPNYNDKPRVGLLHPGDGNAMGTYLEQYQYDEVGNFVKILHRGSDPVHPGWTRTYAYDEDSQLESGEKRSNRLTSTTIGNITEVYSPKGDGYDAHGNMLSMPHLQVMQWDFRDQLCMTLRQKVNNEDEEGIQRQGEQTYYVYDATGQRVRKVTELNTGQVKDERVYLGVFEIYRRNGANPLVRETLHIMDEKQRIALVETRTQGNGPAPQQLIRYQFGNHLGSASLELDDQAQIISYEEYYPYGSTSYQAVRSQTETPKRYRYTGKERDEESGLSYHTARYYSSWLGRWTSCDPSDLVDGPNIYSYVGNNPLRNTDLSGRQYGGMGPPMPMPEIPVDVRLAVYTTMAERKKTEEQLAAVLAAGNTGKESEDRLKELEDRLSTLNKASILSIMGAVTPVLAGKTSPIIPAEPTATPSDPAQLTQASSSNQSVQNPDNQSSAQGQRTKTAESPITEPTELPPLPPEDWHAPGDVPNNYTIVRGGTNPLPASGETISGAQGIDVNEAASYVPHGKIRATTAGSLRKEGGTVQVAPEPAAEGKPELNYSHVNIIEGPVSTFSELKENPIKPGKVRMKGPAIMAPPKKSN